MTAAVLAVDGGNSKTDVALIGSDGTLLGLSRGPGSCHQNIGVEATMQVLSELVAIAAAEAGLGPDRLRWRGTAPFYLAGADLPVEIAMLDEAADRHRLGRPTSWSTTTPSRCCGRAPSHRTRVAVVCGAGINCVGVSAAGEVARFPSLGPLSGDWGGGRAAGPRKHSGWPCARRTAGAARPR